MSTQALYRQWRPDRFADVVGQDAIITTLQNQVATGRVSHAYLFCGSRGTGKTTTAKLFARAVNCLSPEGGEPCGQCDACLALAAENNLDIIEIDAASNNGVDEIRDLRDKIKYPPQHGRYRVYIIDEVHMLSTGAFNALLKTLEEPPPHALFILATTEPQRLPATVLSRVQRYDFRRIPVQTIVQRLQVIAQGEKGDVTPDALALIAHTAEGGMRDAVSLLDMALSYGGGSVDAALVRDIIGAADRGFLFSFADALLRGDAAACLHAIDELMRAGREPQVFARDITGHLRALLMAQTAGDALPDLLEITPEDAARYREQSAQVGRERLLSLLDLFLATEADMKWASQPRIALEVAAARGCLPEESLQLQAIAARVELLEKRGPVAVASPQTAPAADSRPAEAEAPAPVQQRPAAPPPKASAARPAAGDSADIWGRVKASLRAEPQIYPHLFQAQFEGIQDDAATLTFAKGGEIFMNLLSRDATRARLGEAFSQACGHTVAVLLRMQSEKPAAASASKADIQQQAFDLFGRANVQIVDEMDTNA